MPIVRVSSAGYDAVPTEADGRFVSLATPVTRRALRPAVRYVVEVERAHVRELETFAAAVDTILTDPRGWEPIVDAAFVPTTTEPDVRITLASPGTVDELCAPLRTGGVLSCSRGGRAVINHIRWTEGSAGYGADLEGYRAYLINHEVGHALGFGHVSCPAEGAPAPVMMQQTKGLGACDPNPWPSVG